VLELLKSKVPKSNSPRMICVLDDKNKQRKHKYIVMEFIEGFLLKDLKKFFISSEKDFVNILFLFSL
jgi:serine/threonine protein kinase